MYNYATERPDLFTEEGQVLFLAIRDETQKLLKISGAARMQEIIRGQTGCTWRMLAAVDRLVELGEILELTNEKTCGQYRVFVSKMSDA